MRSERRLPKTHTVTSHMEWGPGGYWIQYYADEDGASGYGMDPLEQRWYGSREECEERIRSRVIPEGGWYRPFTSEGPDRTDPGYHLDNF